jgi:N-carbamoyl-L-amino-acid hydrolase
VAALRRGARGVEFRRLFLGQAASALGDRIAPVALAFAVLDLTGSAAALGVVLAAQTLPLAAFVLVGGVWADRLPRRLVLLASDGVRLVAQGLTALLLVTGTARLWQLVVLQAAYGAAEAFFRPAMHAVIPEVVTAARLQQANALTGLSLNVAMVVGPPIAAIVVAVTSPGAAVAGGALALRLPPRRRLDLLPLHRVGHDRAAAGAARAARPGGVDRLLRLHGAHAVCTFGVAGGSRRRLDGRVDVAAEFRGLFTGLAAIGRDPDGGWTRLAWTGEDDAAREWFVAEATSLGLEVETDRNTNLWAWWGRRGERAVATGSHLDTVPGGGAYDGALGVVAAFLAVRLLRERGFVPRLPIVVAAFCDEEGAASGLPAFGSRLATGALDRARARPHLPPGTNPGPDPERLAQLSAFVELHVEQGRALTDLDAPVAVGTGVWPHGRWRVTLDGEGNHAGTTRLPDRRDPALPLATAITAARRCAAGCDGVATVGRVEVRPGATNGVAAQAVAWLDARAPQDAALDRLVGWWAQDVADAAAEHHVTCTLREESRSPAVAFDPALADRLAAVLQLWALPAPRLDTAAGHDAAALAAAVPTGMLFVRNPTGASHTPGESASDADCVLGAEVLADVLADLAS